VPNTSPLGPFLAMAVVAAGGCGSGAAADPPPKLADLLAEYKGLGLPLPPAKARLVRYESGGGGIVNGRVQPTTYSLAFELQPGTKEAGPLLLEGGSEWRPRWDPKAVEVKPEAAAANGVDLGSDTALTLAIQCHARGWDALAQALLARGQPEEGKATPTGRLVNLAWDYWVERLTHPTAERAPVAKRMKALMERDPALDTEHHRGLLKSLELALVPGKGKPGSVEALIDALVDYHADTGTMGAYEPGDAYWRIAEKGFDAVPALIAALGDDRLTRSMMVGFNNFRSWNLRVGDVAGDLLEGLAGEELDRGAGGKSVGGGWLRRQQGYRVTPEAAKAWWAKTEKVGEEPYVLDKVLPPVAPEGRTLWPRPLPLRLFVAKYPNRLPELYRTVLDKRPDVQSWPLAEAVTKSSLPAKDKLALFEVAGRHKDLDHRLPALRALKGLDAKRFDALLLATVEGLPKDVTEDYWKCREAAVARLAVASDDPKVWAALEAAIRRAAFGLRMELLHHLVDRNEPRRRGDRLRLLAAHLDDAEVRDRSADKRFDGPGAGFPYDRITAGDAIAADLASMVGVEVPTKLDRTPTEWAELREKVRTAVKAELDKLK
jgi:hypothetical protein